MWIFIAFINFNSHIFFFKLREKEKTNKDILMFKHRILEARRARTEIFLVLTLHTFFLST